MKINGKELFSILLVAMLVTSMGIVFVQGTESAKAIMEANPEDESEPEISDEDGDHISDDFEYLNERDVQVELEEDQIEIESVLKNGNQQDKIKIHLKFDGEGLAVKLSYENEFDSENPGLELESEYELNTKIVFQKIIEYIDIDEDGLFNNSIDQEVQQHLLNSFNLPIYAQIVIDENTTLHYLNISTSDGVFTAHFYITEEFTEVNTLLITPTQTKIDIEIKDFNYLEADSQLALYTKLESEEEYHEEAETDDEQHGYKHDESGIETIQNGFIGFFTWADNATVDGIEKEVLVSPVESDDDINEKIYINYPRGNLIYHDPTFGIANIYINPGATNFLIPIIIGVSAALSIAVVAGLLIKAKTKRN